MPLSFTTLQPGDYAYLLVTPGRGVGLEPYELNALPVLSSAADRISFHLATPGPPIAVQKAGGQWRLVGPDYPVVLVHRLPLAKVKNEQLLEAAELDVTSLKKQLATLRRNISRLQEQESRLAHELSRRAAQRDEHQVRLSSDWPHALS